MQKIRLNTARNALRLLIKAYNIKEIFVPYYICPAVREAIIKENSKIKFYHINDNFFPDNEALKNFKKDSFILYPNYFGICSKNVYSLSSDYKNLIVDNAQSFFMNQNVGLASFVSLRKFFNLPDGSILYTMEKLNGDFINNLEQDNDRNAPKNEEEFLLNEKFLNSLNIKLMSKRTSNFFDKLSLEHEKEKRLEKFYNIHNVLKDSNNLKFLINNDNVPYIYPYLTNDKETNSDIVRNILNKYTALRFWNNLPKSFNEYKFYKYLMAILM